MWQISRKCYSIRKNPLFLCFLIEYPWEYLWLKRNVLMWQCSNGYWGSSHIFSLWPIEIFASPVPNLAAYLVFSDLCPLLSEILTSCPCLSPCTPPFLFQICSKDEFPKLGPNCHGDILVFAIISPVVLWDLVSWHVKCGCCRNLDLREKDICFDSCS